jgi:hypothetical protein
VEHPIESYGRPGAGQSEPAGPQSPPQYPQGAVRFRSPPLPEAC